jgi:hypothetical protein
VIFLKYLLKLDLQFEFSWCIPPFDFVTSLNFDVIHDPISKQIQACLEALAFKASGVVLKLLNPRLLLCTASL